MNTEIRMTLRLPLWAAEFLDRVGKENLTSRNAEIIRCVKERMELSDKPSIAKDASEFHHPATD